MPLTMRPTGLGSGIDKDRPDYTVVTGEWEVGRIYETRGGPDNLRWFLVDDRQRSDDTLGSRGDPGGSQGAISEKLGRLEGVGEAGRGAMTRLEQRGRRRLRRRDPHRAGDRGLGTGLEDDASLARLFGQPKLLHLRAHLVLVTAKEACGLCNRPAVGEFVR